ncbi:hypothetical protein FRC06_008714, partial [Ceratobasidium sp. 370]
MDAQQLATALAANPQLLQQALALVTAQNPTRNEPRTATPPAPPGSEREADRRARSPTIRPSSPPAGTAGETSRGRTLQRQVRPLSNGTGPSSSSVRHGPLPLRCHAPAPAPAPTLHPTSTTALAAIPTIAPTTPVLGLGPVATFTILGRGRGLVLVTLVLVTLGPVGLGRVLSLSLGPTLSLISLALILTPVTAIAIPSPSPSLGPGKRGGRVKKMVDGKEQIALTSIERLATRKAKFDYFKRHRHLFGKKHDTYFNPYSYKRSHTQNYKRIARPRGFQVGRGGDDQIHELIGLRGDYNYFSDILGHIRKAVLKYKPRNVIVPEGKGLKWANYSLTARRKINDYVLEYHPFLTHFRDDSNEDNWVIGSLAPMYLARNRSYVS